MTLLLEGNRINKMIYKTKPVQIEAMQYDGTYESYNKMVKHWGKDFFRMCHHHDGLFQIETLEGRRRASKDDFIIKNMEGEYYPCNPSIFYKKYEPV